MCFCAEMGIRRLRFCLPAFCQGDSRGTGARMSRHCRILVTPVESPRSCIIMGGSWIHMTRGAQGGGVF
jgi:hypothetical protein